MCSTWSVFRAARTATRRELSGGEQQRVAIARALVNISGHDHRRRAHRQPRPRAAVSRSCCCFQKINELGTTVLVVTHEKELVERLLQARCRRATVAMSSATEWTGTTAMNLNRLGYLIKAGLHRHIQPRPHARSPPSRSSCRLPHHHGELRPCGCERG